MRIIVLRETERLMVCRFMLMDNYSSTVMPILWTQKTYSWDKRGRKTAYITPGLFGNGYFHYSFDELMENRILEFDL